MATPARPAAPPAAAAAANHNLLARVILQMAALLRLLLWPIRLVTQFLFPPLEFDGLAPAVTAKAAQQAIAHIRSLAPAGYANSNAPPPPQALQLFDQAWSAGAALGFAVLKQQAVATQSLLLVYLHAPLHSQANRTCSETLHHAALLQLLTTSSSSSSSNGRLVATAYSIHSAQGAQLQSLLQITSFPAIAVLQPNLSAGGNNSSSNNVLNLVLVVQGARQCRVDTLVPLLQMTLHRHQQAVADVHRRHLQRLQETELRRQQDEEYQATLAADQERDRAVALERHAEQEAAAALQNEQDEKERQASLALQAARDLILPEPSEGGTMIRFVLPSGAKINRRFVGQQTTMAAVKAFLTVYFCDSNIQIANIGLSTNFPRRTFEAGADDALTLEEAGLAPQAVLMVQDLDA